MAVSSDKGCIKRVLNFYCKFDLLLLSLSFTVRYTKATEYFFSRRNNPVNECVAIFKPFAIVEWSVGNL